MRKKIRPTSWQALTPFTLYLEDIRSLHDIISEVCDEIRYETGDFTDISGPDELAAVGTPTVGELTMTGLTGGTQQIELRLTRGSATAAATSDSNEMVGTIEKIKRVCRRHTRSVSIANIWMVLIGPLAILIVDALTNPTLSGVGVVIALAFALAFGAFVVFRVKTNYVIVYVVPKSQLPNFWTRNRDNIVVGLLAAGAGAILTYGIGRLAG